MNDDSPKHRYLYLPIGLVLVLLILSIYFHFRANPLMKKARELRQSLAQNGANLSPQERQQKREQLRDTMRAMSPGQRQELTRDDRKRFEERMLNYVKMSQPEKTRLLDEQIDRMEQMRRNSPNTGPGPGSRTPTNRSAEDRERMRRERLDQTTPEFRSAMDQYRRDMAARRQQRGLPPLGRR
jgi:hypothetical protein